MAKLARLPLAIGLGIIAYLLVFGLFVHRPFTTDEIGGYIARKQAILAANPSPRIVIFAGSNALFSHSCAEITARTGIACVNLGYVATVGLKFQIDAYIDQLHKGDVIYIPLEYREPGSLDLLKVGFEAPYLFYHDRRRLPQLYDWRGVAQAAFGFDFRLLLTSIGEMALRHAGIQRRINVDTMNTVGDEIGHTPAKAAAYRLSLMELPVRVVDPALYADRAEWQVVGAQLRRLTDKGVVIVGGLPTTPADTVIDPDVIAFSRAYFAAAGGCFLVLPNRSQYPRSYFYDTNYHLNEVWQHHHSAALAAPLAAIFRAGTCR